MKTLSSKHPGFYYNFTTNDGYDLPPFAKILKNSQKISKFYHLGKSPQNPANLGISGRNLVMIRIMFVCHGNICRSPMAEFIMKKLVNDEGLADQFLISSSATSTEEIWHGQGNPVYPPAKAELKKHGISADGKFAIQLQASDYDKYDYLIGMDTMNIRNMKRILGADKEEKIYKMMTFAGSSDDVADPWYSGDFRTTYNDIDEACRGLLKYLKERNKI